MLTTEHNSGKWPFDAANAEALNLKLDRLEKFVSNTVSAMAESLSVSPEEALSILINVHVKFMGHLSGTVQSHMDEKLLKRVGPEYLCKEIEEVIRAISKATALDTDEITEIFAQNAIANIPEISYCLHLRSLIDRSFTS